MNRKKIFIALIVLFVLIAGFFVAGHLLKPQIPDPKRMPPAAVMKSRGFPLLPQEERLKFYKNFQWKPHDFSKLSPKEREIVDRNMKLMHLDHLEALFKLPKEERLKLLIQGPPPNSRPPMPNSRSATGGKSQPDDISTYPSESENKLMLEMMTPRQRAMQNIMSGEMQKMANEHSGGGFSKR